MRPTFRSTGVVLVAALCGACASPAQSPGRSGRSILESIPLTVDTAPLTVDELAQRDIASSPAPGVIIGVYDEGALRVLEAWGHASKESTEPLSPEALFQFASFTEVLVAATVRGMADANMLDTGTPLRSYLPDLPQGLGSITLAQLLSHTSGLDAVRVEDDEDWSVVLDRLSDRALFTDPGLIYSPSPYSYPLAIRALEAISGERIRGLVTRAVLEPLGMNRTTFDMVQARSLGLVQRYEQVGKGLGAALPSDPIVAVDPVEELHGLPVVFTTARDVIRLFAAMTAGGLRGESPFARGPKGVAVLAGQHFLDGLWMSRFRGVDSANLSGGASVRIFPGQGTIVVSLGSSQAASFVLDRTTWALGLASEPRRETMRFEEPIPSTDLDMLEWIGDYRNGEGIFALREFQGGVAFYDGSSHLPVYMVSPSVYAARIMDGRYGETFSLYEIDGWRFSFFQGKSFARDP